MTKCTDDMAIALGKALAGDLSATPEQIGAILAILAKGGEAAKRISAAMPKAVDEDYILSLSEQDQPAAWRAAAIDVMTTKGILAGIREIMAECGRESGNILLGRHRLDESDVDGNLIMLFQYWISSRDARDLIMNNDTTPLTNRWNYRNLPRPPCRTLYPVTDMGDFLDRGRS